MRDCWTIDPEITYLNHGSFGPPPRVVQESQLEWMRKLAANPQRFLAREQEFLLEEVLQKLGGFVGCAGDDLLPMDNATFGMNLVARSLPLQSEDEVLLTTHEYGAVKRIWQQIGQAAGARVVQAYLPEPFESTEQIVEQVRLAITPRTRLLVVSHVTSPTAVVFPVEQICRLARERGIPVCIDGPHAVAMRPLDIAALGCDFYVASCHKWLSAPFGTGFLYVHPRWQQKLRPFLLSWGGSSCGREKSWKDEYLWLGTRDLTRFLAIPAAIQFLEEYGLEKFREETHQLAAYARDSLQELMQQACPIPDHLDWYGSMVTVPLPEHLPVPQTWTGLPHPLQLTLTEKYKMEVPVVKWGHRMHIRVSCHLYNDRADVDRLCQALFAEGVC